MTMIVITYEKKMKEFISRKHNYDMDNNLKSVDSLSSDEMSNFLKKCNTEVKVRFKTGEIIGFYPFKKCMSMPARYACTIYLNKDSIGSLEYPYKLEYIEETTFIRKIDEYGLESNNIQYLSEANFNVSNITLNLKL